MKTGIVSVTFRANTASRIVELASGAKLDGIEWGSDVHCRVGDIKEAHRVRALTEDAGLEVLSYGSYYRVGEGDDFAEILSTAVALNAPNIRVWAGTIGSEEATKEYREKVVADARAIAELAKGQGITVSFEYHGKTLTDTQKSTVKLLNEIDNDNIYTYWQPLANTTYKENLANIDELCAMGKLKNIHVYHWIDGKRYPLSDGTNEWKEYIKHAKSSTNSAMLEFVEDDSEPLFAVDCGVFKEIMK